MSLVGTQLQTGSKSYTTAATNPQLWKTHLGKPANPDHHDC